MDRSCPMCAAPLTFTQIYAPRDRRITDEVRRTEVTVSGNCTQGCAVEVTRQQPSDDFVRRAFAAVLKGLSGS